MFSVSLNHFTEILYLDWNFRNLHRKKKKREIDESRGWVGGGLGSCGMLQLHQHELAQNSLIVRYLRHKLPTTAVKIVKMGNIMAVRVGFLWPINGKVCNACTCNRFVARHVAAVAATLSASPSPPVQLSTRPAVHLTEPADPWSSLFHFFSFRSLLIPTLFAQIEFYVIALRLRFQIVSTQNCRTFCPSL